MDVFVEWVLQRRGRVNTSLQYHKSVYKTFLVREGLICLIAVSWRRNYSEQHLSSKHSAAK